jgi:hypothetical protein
MKLSHSLKDRYAGTYIHTYIFIYIESAIQLLPLLCSVALYWVTVATDVPRYSPGVNAGIATDVLRNL